MTLPRRHIAEPRYLWARCDAAARHIAGPQRKVEGWLRRRRHTVPPRGAGAPPRHIFTYSRRSGISRVIIAIGRGGGDAGANPRALRFVFSVLGNELVEQLRPKLPQLGQKMAVDSKAIASFCNPVGDEDKRLEPDRRRDLDADWGTETYDLPRPARGLQRARKSPSAGLVTSSTCWASSATASGANAR